MGFSISASIHPLPPEKENLPSVHELYSFKSVYFHNHTHHENSFCVVNLVWAVVCLDQTWQAYHFSSPSAKECLTCTYVLFWYYSHLDCPNKMWTCDKTFLMSNESMKIHALYHYLQQMQMFLKFMVVCYFLWFHYSVNKYSDDTAH